MSNQKQTEEALIAMLEAFDVGQSRCGNGSAIKKARDAVHEIQKSRAPEAIVLYRHIIQTTFIRTGRVTSFQSLWQSEESHDYVDRFAHNRYKHVKIIHTESKVVKL